MQISPLLNLSRIYGHLLPPIRLRPTLTSLARNKPTVPKALPGLRSTQKYLSPLIALRWEVEFGVEEALKRPSLSTPHRVCWANKPASHPPPKRHLGERQGCPNGGRMSLSVLRNQVAYFLSFCRHRETEQNACKEGLMKPCVCRKEKEGTASIFNSLGLKCILTYDRSLWKVVSLENRGLYLKMDQTQTMHLCE